MYKRMTVGQIQSGDGKERISLEEGRVRSEKEDAVRDRRCT
jgi:hypothetical protein